MAVATDNYASENVLYTISRPIQYGIILIPASEYPSTTQTTAAAIGPVGQLIYMIQCFYASWN